MDEPGGGWRAKGVRRTVLAGTLASSLAACSLLTNLDGLAGGGPATAGDGALPSESAPPEGSAPIDPDGSAAAEAASDGPAASRYETEVLADLPKAFFPFDDATGATAKDRMGGAPGTYSDSGVAFGQPGAFAGSGAVALDSVAGRVSLGNRFPFVGRAPFSIEIWLKPSVIDASVRWIVNRCSGDPTSTNSFGILAYTNQTLFQRLTPGGDSYAQGPTLVTARFVHVVATFDGARNNLYLDGALVDSGPVGAGDLTDVTGSELLVGDTQLPRPSKLGGVIDELAIYDKELTPERVMAHFVASKP